MRLFVPTIRAFALGFRRGFADPIFRVLFGLVVGLLALGTIAFHLTEGWDWLDALYFSIVTMATVGYGDLAPRTPLGKMLAIVFIVLGIGVLVAFAQRLVAQMVTNAQERMAAAATTPAPAGVQRRIRSRLRRRVRAKRFAAPQSAVDAPIHDPSAVDRTGDTLP